jgi:hypothetical protein
MRMGSTHCHKCIKKSSILFIDWKSTMHLGEFFHEPSGQTEKTERKCRIAVERERE